MVHLAVLEHAPDRHRQRRRYQERDWQQVDQPDNGVGGDDKDDRRQHHACTDRDPVPELDPVAGLGVGDGDDEGGRREQRAAKRSPAAVVYQLEQEEVDQQQGEQAGVAVEEPNDRQSGRASRW
jgi:hypothetical protein